MTSRTLKDLMALSGRVALVTGGAGHVGQAACEGLAELGATVVVSDLDDVLCREQAERLSSLYAVRAMGMACSLEDEGAVRSLPARVAESLGSLDILVHCAAFLGGTALPGWATPFLDQTSASFRRALEVNLTAAFVMTQEATPHLARTSRGSVVFLGSIYGILGPDWRLYEGTPMGNPAAYAASKGAILQLTRWLATTLAPRVRVNCISPGGIARGQAESFVERYVSRVPLRRMAIEEDLKGAVVFLASDLSSYVTGQNLVVDGGWSAW